MCVGLWTLWQVNSLPFPQRLVWEGWDKKSEVEVSSHSPHKWECWEWNLSLCFRREDAYPYTLGQCEYIQFSDLVRWEFLWSFNSVMLRKEYFGQSGHFKCGLLWWYWSWCFFKNCFVLNDFWHGIHGNLTSAGLLSTSLSASFNAAGVDGAAELSAGSSEISERAAVCWSRWGYRNRAFCSSFYIYI